MTFAAILIANHIKIIQIQAQAICEHTKAVIAKRLQL